ncbi:hypothetical protein ZWY2020_010376 [Hordeum vulgare]|nr:hypothetical protein ZWY2020_010376 [Hordeum vulgare]
MSSFGVEMELRKRTIDYNPKRTRFLKQHRGRMKGKSFRGNRFVLVDMLFKHLNPLGSRAR